MFIFARAEVAGGGFDGGEAEQGLDLGGVGAALAQACGRGVAAAMGPQAGDAGVVAGGQDDLDDAGDGERAALPGPQRPGIAAAFVQPGGEAVAGNLGKGNRADLVALAVQADRAGGDRDVLGVESCAFFLAGSGVEQDGKDGGVAGAAAAGGSFDAALLGGGEGIGFAGAGNAGAFDGNAQASVVIQQGDGGQGLVDRGRGGLVTYEVTAPGGDSGLGADRVGERVGIVSRPGGQSVHVRDAYAMVCLR